MRNHGLGPFGRGAIRQAQHRLQRMAAGAPEAFHSRLIATTVRSGGRKAAALLVETWAQLGTATSSGFITLMPARVHTGQFPLGTAAGRRQKQCRLRSRPSGQPVGSRAQCSLTQGPHPARPWPAWTTVQKECLSRPVYPAARKSAHMRTLHHERCL